MNLSNLTIEQLSKIGDRTHRKTIPAGWVSNSLIYRCQRITDKLTTAEREKRIKEGKYYGSK